MLQQLGGCKSGTGDGVIEGLGLRFGGRRRSQGRCRLRGRMCFAHECHFIPDTATKVGKGLADIRWVVVGLIVVLVAATRVRLSPTGSRSETHVTVSSFWCTCLRASTRFSSSTYSGGRGVYRAPVSAYCALRLSEPYLLSGLTSQFFDAVDRALRKRCNCRVPGRATPVLT